MYRLGMACVAVSAACALFAVLYVYLRGLIDDLLYLLGVPSLINNVWFLVAMLGWFLAGIAGGVLFHHSHAPGASRRWLGSLPLFAFLAFVISLPFALLSTYPRGNNGSCLNFQRQLAVATLMYAQDYQLRLPQAWEEINVPAELLVCPMTERRFLLKPGGFGMNAALRGVSLESVQDPAATLLTADSVRMTSYLHTPEDIDYSRHGTFRNPLANASYLDGAVGTLRPGAVVRLR
jgi:hypothetical protein